MEGTAAALVPERATLPKLREAAAGCKACDLWKTGTQTVFGEGPAKARLIFLGEQPGDREDREGKPFVGPAGRMLDRALEEVGIPRGETYVTNVVKHFKWTQGRGKRRLHQRPNAEEIRACRPWLESELAVIKPELLVCLGATAAKAVFGSKFRVTKDRGTFVPTPFGPEGTATVHPSSLLRIDEEEERRMAIAEFTADMARIAERLRNGA